MKLHNLLLTAALFLSAGIVSALESTTPEQIQDPVFQREANKGYWTTSGNNTLNIVVIEHASGYGYSLIGYDTTTQSWKNLADLNSGDYLSKNDKKQYAQIYKDFGGTANINGVKVYELTVSFDNTAIDKVGILGHNGSIDQSVISALNDPATNGSIFTFLDKYEEAVGFNNKDSLKGIVVMKGASYVGNGESGGGNGTNGQPLPAPIVTLLIALGFGAVLVYRRKQAKA